MSRQGRVIRRCFSDGIYGGADAALSMAIAYRDAVTRTIPPVVNRSWAARRRSTNTSGIPGVYRGRIRGHSFWEAYLFTATEDKRKRFFDRDHGEPEAKQKAIELRQQWLAEMPAQFRNLDEAFDEEARRQFPEALHHVPSVLGIDDEWRDARNRLELELARIDEQFDRMRPHRLIVCVTMEKGGTRINVAVSDAKAPSKRNVRKFSIRTVSSEQAERKARELLMEGITTVFDSATCERFMADHGSNLTMAALARDGFKRQIPIPCTELPLPGAQG